MALKKSELYSSLWASCDELRGGMDASQYKDYVLVLLFIKYISDKYAGQKYAPITIPKGASFADMVALKGKTDIGDQINKKIIAPLAKENKLSDMPDFDDSTKLGSGKEKADRLENLIGIFENPALDFSKNRADGDDILGDAYEYLMRHFATESGKSKGQFYTPAEVSRIMAQILGVAKDKVTADTTVYDPTCGSGSLLLKVGDEAKVKPTLYGQEKDSATSGLARMNMILHNNPTALITQGNTIADPKFKDGNNLKQFDYVIANPPFSDKRWSTGIDPANDPYDRFKTFGVPPAKQGDYAYLLHIVRSLKSTGKGACILPHGVLFRGNAEADIRKNLITKNGCYIKGIIGLPANLFYGTGIPACIIVIEKKEASTRKGIFMIDASQGFIKDGPKNRLREQDIHKIVDVFNNQTEISKFSRMVPLEEIQKNEYNLNLPRYIDSQVIEDQQDIAGHLQGGIPKADIDALSKYWEVCPNLKKSLFKEARKGYFNLTVEKSQIKSTIFEHQEFRNFTTSMNAHFEAWMSKTTKSLKKLASGFHPKEELKKLSEDLLHYYEGKALIDAYDIYQHLMTYWTATMSDDFYLISSEGWKASTYRIIEKDKKGKEKDKGWTCDLIPKELIIAKYFEKERAELAKVSSELEFITSQITEMEEEHGGDEGTFSELEKINKANATSRLKEIAKDKDAQDEAAILKKYIELCENEKELKDKVKELDTSLNKKSYDKYPKLNEADVKELVVEYKWMATLEKEIHGELDRVSQQLATGIKELAERYEFALPELINAVSAFESKVKQHLNKILSTSSTKKLKKTDVGNIPEDWDAVRMEKVGEPIIGLTYKPTDVSDYGTLVLRSSNIQENRLSFRDNVYVNMNVPDRVITKENDLLICVRNGSKQLIGKCALIDKKTEGSAFGAFMSVFRGETNRLMLYQFQSSIIQKQIDAVMGATINQLTNKNLRDFFVPLPKTKDEQDAIADALSDMDSYLQSSEKLNEKYRYIQKGMMQELLTGRIRLV